VYCRVLPGVAESAYLGRFPCPLLPVGAGCCALGGVGMASPNVGGPTSQINPCLPPPHPMP
jgi:hypothetical protein